MTHLVMKIVFMVLNTGLTIGIFVWLIYSRLIPAVRASLTRYTESHTTLTQDVSQLKNELTTARENQVRQEREIARLTTCIEQWAGVLAQRAAYAQQEARDLAFRYKQRQEENTRAYVTHAAHQVVTKQVIKDARAILEREYADEKKREQYIEKMCAYMAKKGAHENA